MKSIALHSGAHIDSGRDQFAEKTTLTCSRAAAVRCVLVWAARSSSSRTSAAVTSSLRAATMRPSLT